MFIRRTIALLLMLAAGSNLSANAETVLPEGVSAADWQYIQQQIQGQRFYAQAAEMVLNGSTLAMQVDDHAAVYPVTIAATFAQQTYIKASNTDIDDRFGESIAVDGDTLVVGAPFEDSNATGGQADNTADGAGAVYVFVRNDTGWSQQAYLKASNAESGDQFGVSVAISGDTLVVGAAGESSGATLGEADNSAEDAGAAYVFTRSGTDWTQQAFLKASNAESGDLFGQSVTVSGDTLAVGATNESSSATGGETDNSASAAGAAYVFVRAGTSWTQQAFLKASNAASADLFGNSVALDADTLVVGAPLEDSSASGGETDNSSSQSGAAYVFVRTGTSWTQQGFLKASNTDPGDRFALSIGLSGDTVVVGASGEDSSAIDGETDNSADDAGAAYIFVRNNMIWSQQALLKASNAGSDDKFASSVAISGDRLVVGAPEESSSAMGGESDNSAEDAGATYVFVRNGSDWTQQAYLKASNAEEDDSFGVSVALDGGTLVFGAPSEEGGATGVDGDQSDNSASSSGAVYVFELGDLIFADRFE